ncbi:dihydrodipicolinate reductase [Jiangella asiatica]|uniref:Dihydrodipicolinate reductase n=1 Tax=Jiangella asiatica TaxID=2530372 RepID=A0A4R5D985_9ACTN|nr:dihydrodipicolinate reductase [Jiangella asiatica]TDE08460.1 dihydrodipicolinate reductase [Jiangella asiatica]
MSEGAHQPLSEGIPVLGYGLGPIGLGVAALLAGRDGVTLVGAVDIDPDKIGTDLGLLHGGGKNGVRVTSEVPAAPPGGVAVHATGSGLVDVAPQLEELLDRGWNVVSTCEQLVHPWSVDAQVALRLDALAHDRERSVLGSGINPGYLMDTLVLMLTGACTAVRGVHVTRVVDTNARRIPLQVKAGVGLTREEFVRRARHGRLGHVGLRQSAHVVADRLGWRLDGYEERIEPVVAGEPTATGLGVIAPGDVIGQRQRVVATSGGRDVIQYDLEMSAGAEATDVIEIDGEPAVHQRIVGGVNGDVGTVAVIGNLVPVVADARPGLLTMADVVRMAAAVGLIAPPEAVAAR